MASVEMTAVTSSGRFLLLLAVVAVSTVAAVAPNASAQEEPLTYVSLGDSYISGPLVLPHDRTHVPEDCGQSVRNHPHLAAAAVGLDLVDVSCGSAKIEDLYAPQTGLPAGGTNAAQFDALGPDVDIVSLGISGNDVGFVGFALDCVRLVGPPTEEPCTPDDAGPDDEMSRDIAATAPLLAQAIRDIERLAPNAEIFFINYPTALPDDGVGCWPYLPILDEDMPYLVEKYKEMNAMVASVAAAEGVTLVDIYTPSIGHDACQIPAIAWVNGMVVVPPSYPAHPNEFGLAASGEVLASALSAHLDSLEARGATGGSPADPTAGTTPTPDVERAAATATVPSLPATGPSFRPEWAFLILPAGLWLRRRLGAG